MSDGTRVHSQHPDIGSGSTQVKVQPDVGPDPKDHMLSKGGKEQTHFGGDSSIFWWVLDEDEKEAFGYGPIGAFRFFPDLRELYVGVDIVRDESLDAWLESHGTNTRFSPSKPPGFTMTAHRRQPVGQKPASLCMGQVWKLPEGSVTVERIGEERVTVSSSNKAQYSVTSRRFAEEGEFISGPQTPEEEILYVAQREIEDIPEGMKPERWLMIVAAAREQIFVTYAAPIVAAQQFLEAIDLVRKLAPLFTRAI